MKAIEDKEEHLKNVERNLSDILSPCLHDAGIEDARSVMT